MELLRLKELLKEKNITGKELADQLGVTAATVSNIANGNHFPKPDLLKKIATELNITVKDLFAPGEDEEAIYLKRENTYIKIGEIKKNLLT